MVFPRRRIFKKSRKECSDRLQTSSYTYYRYSYTMYVRSNFTLMITHTRLLPDKVIVNSSNH